MTPLRFCSVHECGEKHYGRGYCEKHYQRFHKHGAPDIVLPNAKMKSIREQVWDRVKVTPSGCWEWQGARDKKGYGSVRVKGKTRRVHRLAWELTYGGVPVSLLVCHRCDNPPCINPEHLLAQTSKENTMDMERRIRYKGRFKIGRIPENRKFTPAKISAIRRKYRTGTCTQKELAAKHSTSQGHISNIITERAWQTH